MYKKILVPIDGTEFAEQSIECAKALAGGDEAAEVVLLQVIEHNPQINDIGGLSSERWYRDAQARCQAKVKKYISQVTNKLKEDGIAVKSTITQGRVADEIINYTKNSQADLIVMNSHRRSGISRLLHGSVADEVLRHSAVPVLLVEPCSNSEQNPSLAN